MRLMTFRYAGKDHAGVLTPAGLVPVLEINSKHDLHLPNSVLEIIQNEIRGIPVHGVQPIPLNDVEPQLPYRVPPKIWCIGLNYKTHAEDIDAAQPEEPGSFMKPASCMFRPGGKILLPPPEVSNDVDAEGELALIIGRSCRFVPAEKAHEVIYGFTTTLDLTALDVLRKNPRYLTRAQATTWTQFAGGAFEEIVSGAPAPASSSPRWNSREAARAGFGPRARRKEEVDAGHLRRRATKLLG